MWHISNIYTTKPMQELAQKLAEHIFTGKALFYSSGAEADEAALRPAHKHGYDHFGGHRTEITFCLNSFHGRMLFTVSVGGRPKYSKDYAPLPPGIIHVPLNDVAVLETAISEDTCTVIIKPIQGENGILSATQEYLQVTCRLRDEHGALLILDEAQTDMGHTGKLLAYEHHGVTSDILSSAKVLGSGFSIGTILTTDKIAPTFGPGTHGSASDGNPMACAVDSRAFDITDTPETLVHVEKQGQKPQTALQELDEKTGVFKEIRGMGLLIGCALTGEYQGYISEIIAVVLEHGLTILVAGANVVRFALSLLLNDKDTGEDLKHLEAALEEWVG